MQVDSTNDHLLQPLYDAEMINWLLDEPELLVSPEEFGLVEEH